MRRDWGQGLALGVCLQGAAKEQAGEVKLQKGGGLGKFQEEGSIDEGTCLLLYNLYQELSRSDVRYRPVSVDVTSHVRRK